LTQCTNVEIGEKNLTLVPSFIPFCICIPQAPRRNS